MTRRLLLVLIVGASLSVAWSASTVRPVEPTDALGDLLPPYALLRVGTVRFRHGGPVADLVVSPDGKTVVSSGADAMVRVWDLASGKQLRQWADNNPGWGGSPLTLSPDGKNLAYFDRSTVAIRNPHTGELSRSLANLHVAAGHLTYIDQGNILFYVRLGETAHLLDATSGEEQRSFTIEVPNPDAGVLNNIRSGPAWVRLYALSQDGTLLLTIQPDSGWVWDVAKGERVGKFGGECSSPTALAVSPDKRRYAWTDDQGEVALGKLSGEEVCFFTPVAGEEVRVLTFSADSKHLACGDTHGTISVHATDTGKRLCRFDAHGGGVTCLAYTADGTSLVSGGADGCVRVWDAATGKERVPTHSLRGTTAVALSPDGRLLATAGAGLPIQTWATDSGTAVRSYDLNRAYAGRLCFSPDGTRLTAITDDEVRSWIVATGQRRRPVRYEEDGWTQVSADGRLAVRRDWQRTQVNIFRVADGQPIAPPKRGASPVRSVFSPNGAWVGVCWRARTEDGLLTGSLQFSVYEVASARERYQWELAEETPAAFTPDGSVVVCNHWDSENPADRWPIRLYVVGSWALLPIFRDSELRGEFAGLSPEGRMLVTGTGDGTLLLWELATGKCRVTLTGHRGAVESLAFSADGQRLASGGNDSTALLWDLHAAALGKEPAPKAMTKRVLDSLWADLRSDDAAVAYRAVHILGVFPAETVPYLRGQLRPATVEAKHLRKLIGDLDSPHFEVREKASVELAGLAELAVPALGEAVKEPPSAEVRRRVQDLLEKAKMSPYLLTGERLRSWRALEALELCGTAEARDVLATVAKGDANARLTGEAKRAVERLREVTKR